MKKIFLFALVLLLGPAYSFAQEKVVYHPAEVSKAIYFDVSPPLRDMPVSELTKGDNSWKDGIVKNQPNPFRNKAGNPAEPDPIRQTYFGSKNADTTIQNFEGNSNTQGYLPPDTYGEVGMDHYFQVVNCHYAVYTKTGTKLLQANNSSVWQGLPNNSNDGDATINYDEVNDRWVFSQFSLPSFPNGPFFQMVAVSVTNDPTGSWYRYQFQFTSMPDYPKLAIWPDGIYMSANRFSAGSTTYQGTYAVAFEYAKMITGDPSAQMVTFTLPSSNEAYCVLPSDCDGPYPPAGTPNYFTYLNDQPDRLGIYEFSVDWVTPSNSTYTLVSQLPVQPFNGSLSGVTQKGSSVKLDDHAGRLMYRLQFRKFTGHWSMVANATVNVGSGQAGIRWFELRSTGTTWSIYQQGTYAPDVHNRWMGSIAMDDLGNIALGYSIASTDIYPSIRYTGRMDGDVLGEMTIDESGIANGGGAQTDGSARWGDYSGMSVDPAEQGKFWYTQEYMQNQSAIGWKTRIASFSFSNILTVSTTATPPSICLGESSQLEAEVTGGSGTYTYSWTSIPAGFTSTSPNPVVSPTVTTQYVCAVDDGIESKTDTCSVEVHAEPTAFAGKDTSYAFTLTLVPVTGQATDYESVKWTTAGDGYFNMDSLLNSLYYTGWQDRAAGEVTLTLTAYPIPTCATPASDDIVITFSPSVGIPDPITGPFGITLSPNPTRGNLNLMIRNLSENYADITISDIQGKSVYSGRMDGPGKDLVKKIDLNGFSKGIYFVKVKTESSVKTEKLILQ